MSTRIFLHRFNAADGTPRARVLDHNAIDDFRAFDPNATVEELDALALSDLLAADRAFDRVVADTQAHHRRVAERGYTAIEAPTTRELCERYIAAEIDRADAIERCTHNAAAAPHQSAANTSGVPA
jgi:hypothetical protein